VSENIKQETRPVKCIGEKTRTAERFRFDSRPLIEEILSARQVRERIDSAKPPHRCGR